MADGQFLTLESGKKKLRTAIDQSTGAADGAKIVRTDSTGRIDASFLPPGIGADVKVSNAAEDIDAGDLVHIDALGTVLKADSSNNRPAHGFSLTAVTTGNPVDVMFEGTNNALAGLTVGNRYFLDTAGNVTDVPKTATGELHQFIGVACSATEINIEIEDCIEIL